MVRQLILFIMSVTCSVFIACSIDGYIAREDGGIDWLTGNDEGDSETNEDYGYGEFISTVDAIVMGRNTFEKVRTFEPWPYEKKVIVLTHRNLDLPDRLLDKVSALSGKPEEIAEKLADEGFRHLYIDGGQTISQFLQASLIRELIITRIPVILGKGIPLFTSLQNDIKLDPVSTRSFPNGLIQNRYKVMLPELY
jgi:dihydrofolate reductase